MLTARQPGLCLLGLAAALASAAWAADARAERPPPPASTAQAQFDYGVAEMEAGRYETGCPALAESYRVDPHPGALFTLAECENRWGKLASALTHYDAYLDLHRRMSAAQKANQRGRDKIAAAQAERLRRAVPRLAVKLPADAPETLAVTRDGEPIAQPSLGIPLPVDPGEHLIVARGPDGVEHAQRVRLDPGERRDVVVDLSSATASDREPAPASPRPPSATSSAVPAAAERAAPRTGAPARTAVWVLGAVGVASLALGTATGIVALADRSVIDDHCRPDRTCDARGLSAARSASTWGAVSTGAFGVGIAAAAASVIVYVTSPSHGVARATSTKRWSLRPVAGADAGGAFLGVRGAW